MKQGLRAHFGGQASLSSAQGFLTILGIEPVIDAKTSRRKSVKKQGYGILMSLRGGGGQSASRSNPDNTLEILPGLPRSLAFARNDKKTYGNDRKAAFTLAEVLITLGIIGVVAALTLPSLIAKHQEKQWKVGYKKAYSAMGQAFLMMQSADEYENPYLDGYTTVNPVSGVSVFRSPSIGRNFKTISKYFKYKKECFSANADECWVCDKGQAGYVNNGEPNWLGCQKTGYAFIDTSGMAWHLYSNTEWPVLVDVNGFKKPNKLGKDRFVLKFSSNADKSKLYTEEADTIKPWSDMVDKQRWCPEGNCMYTQWLLE